MPKIQTTPTTFRQAFELADHILCNARDMRLHALATNDYGDEAAKQRLLAAVGTLITARWELEPLALEVDYLRRFCARPRPASPLPVANAFDVPALSAVACEAVAKLADFAAGTCHAIHAAEVAAILERLPATLTRVRELAEAGADLKPAAKWL